MIKAFIWLSDDCLSSTRIKKISFLISLTSLEICLLGSEMWSSLDKSTSPYLGGRGERINGEREPGNEVDVSGLVEWIELGTSPCGRCESRVDKMSPSCHESTRVDFWVDRFRVTIKWPERGDHAKQRIND